MYIVGRFWCFLVAHIIVLFPGSLSFHDGWPLTHLHFSAGGSQVNRPINAWKEGKPGNKAANIRHEYHWLLCFLQELMSILQNPDFWRLVYPNDSPESVLRRRTHLIDLYLNMQDRIVRSMQRHSSIHSIFSNAMEHWTWVWASPTWRTLYAPGLCSRYMYMYMSMYIHHVTPMCNICM